MVIRMTKEIRHFSKNKNLHLILSVIMTILSAFIQVYVIQVFMNPCNLLSSGFTGVAILIHKICNLFNIHFSISLGILMLNIPAALICYKSVSKRFVFLSCLQFGLVSFFLNIFSFTPFFDDLVLNVLFGGFLYGIGITLALKADGSTGGTDFIALYISNKIHKSLWDYVFIFNTIILIIFGFSLDGYMRDIQLSSNLFQPKLFLVSITDMPRLLLKSQPKIQTLSQRLIQKTSNMV